MTISSCLPERPVTPAGIIEEPQTFVTVIVVTYNAERAVGATLESIAAQSADDFDVLVIDGSSEDGTLAIVEDFKTHIPRLSVICEPDNGLYDAMNKGVKAARGEYVIFINAGDVLHDLNVLSAFRSDILGAGGSRPALVYGHTRVVLHDGRAFVRTVRRPSYIWHGQPTIHQSVFFRTDVHRVNPYPYDLYPISADYAVMAAIQIQCANDILIWDRCVASFNNDPASVSNRKLMARTRDAWHVQRTILHTRLSLRFVSLIRRLVAHVYYNMRRGGVFP